ncbi:MAG TPA: ABC transporter ATP-binding protein [Candidatus Limnocylindria bacterium]|nr:ABC transporter ATP-binding protein [Candidatus Limnocylindria bacterium]
MILQKLVLSLIAATAIDRLIDLSGAKSTDYWSTFLPYIAAFVGVGLLALLCIDLGLILLSKLEARVRPELEIRIFDRLIRHSMQFHANTFSGSLVTQVNRFLGAYIALTDQLVMTILRMFTNVIIAIVVIAYFAPGIAVVMLVWTIFFTYLNITLTRRRIYLSKLAAAAGTALTGHLADTMGNVGVVKSFANENREYQTHHELALDQARKKYVSWMRAVRNDATFGMLMTVLQATVLALSVRAVMEGALSVGTLLLIQVYMAQLTNELWGLSGVSRSIEQQLSDAAEMTEILNVPLEITDPERPQKARITKGAIAFDGVDFTHGDSADGDTLFEDFSLHVRPGEKVGVVGRSGSGKTTLTKLLLRFIDVDKGAIRIDGQDIRDLRQDDLRSHIAYVPQEPLLFHRSLHENISYGKPTATEAQIYKAAEEAKAAEFIDVLPKGYETTVGERGVKLSGGQRQRIAIARAILKDAPILVLDEATSALDSESEVLIQKALWELMKGRTAIVIAHRLSTIQKMDRIVVMEEGAIIEQGTHKQLLQKKGTYAKLWAHQSGGFLED